MRNMLNSTDVHWRPYLSGGLPNVVCVQQFDYDDYDDLMWLSEIGYETEREAWAALLPIAMEVSWAPECVTGISHLYAALARQISARLEGEK